MELKKRRKKMRSAMAMLLAVMMIVGLMPMSAKAAAQDVTITNAEYSDSGALNSLTASFKWSTASATSKLVLMEKQLEGTDLTVGDLTNQGKYGTKFKTFDEAVKYDSENGDFGIVAYSGDKSISTSNNNLTIELGENAIPLSRNGRYFIYLWTYWAQSGTRYYYPDNLICVVDVQNGAVQYTPSIGRNSYDESAFKQIVSQTKYSVTVTPADHMTRDESSGAETQEELAGAMTPVVYTADTGYYFPEEYAVATEKGVMVRRDSENQITVFGTPTADAAITLTAPTRKAAANLEEVTFTYAYDVQRNPAIPTKDDAIMTVNSFKAPFKADGKEQYTTYNGTWTLSKMGTYSGMQNNGLSSVNLNGIVNEIVSKYGLSSGKTVVIHELKNGEEHVAYGVVISYDAAGGSAVFLGDNLGGSGAGYLLSLDPVKSPATINVGSIATDFIHAEMPTAVFEAADDKSGKLTDVDSSMVYSVDGGTTWNAVTGTTVTLTDLSEGAVIQIKRSGDGEVTTDSAVQEITITQAETPTLSKEDCTTSSQNDGKITGVDETMEYRLSTAADWTAITGEEVTGLANGTYEVRVKANGTVLASQAAEVEVAAHTCTAQEDWEKNSTKHWKKCSSENCDAHIDEADHIPGAEPTETKAQVCTVCGYELSPALGHQCILHVESVGEQKATCTKTGVQAHYKCTCGKLYWDKECTAEIKDANATVIAMSPHTYKEATCTEPKTCTVCGATEGVALGHTCKPEWESDANNHWHVCSRCEEEVAETKAAHTPDREAPTEDDPVKCEVCNRVLTPALGHQCSLHVTEVKRKEPTCTETGVEKHYECECGKLYWDTACTDEITDTTAVNIPKLDHNWKKEWESDADHHWHVCSECTTPDTKSDHTPGAEATETTAQVCTVCGYELTPALGHQCKLHAERVDAQLATCTETGVKTHYKCECGKLYWNEECTEKIEDANETVIPMSQHPYKAATCTEPKTCEVCGATEGVALGHTCKPEWESDENNHWHVCDRCEEEVAETKEAHTFEWITDKEATATEKGSKHEKCTVCGYQKAAVEIPATGLPAKPAKPEKPTEKVESDAVETGDNTSFGMVLAMLLLSAAGMTVLTIERKRKYRR